jgi:molybdopterin molybdotransferase
MKQFFEKAQSFQKALEYASALIQPIRDREMIFTVDALGRIVADGIISPLNLPGFVRSGMDGYAICSSASRGASQGTPKELRIIGRAQMGSDPSSLPSLAPEEAMEIGTGGPLPPGADAVVILEATERIAIDRVRIFSEMKAGDHIIAADEDFKKGEKLYESGQRIRPVDIGALLALGFQQVSVLRKLTVAVISTGDELVSYNQSPKPGQIREINSQILGAQLSELGAIAKIYGIVKDDRTALLQTVERALAETDFVLLSGGSSVGAKDLTETVLEALGTIHIHGLHMKPGKPTIFAICQEKPVVGLPGNPVSSAVVFAKFVAPLVMRRAGVLRAFAPRLQKVHLSHNLSSIRGRTDFVPMVIRSTGEAASIEQVKGHTTNISTLAKASGLLYVEPDSEGLQAHDEVWFELW